MRIPITNSHKVAILVFAVAFPAGYLLNLKWPRNSAGVIAKPVGNSASDSSLDHGIQPSRRGKYDWQQRCREASSAGVSAWAKILAASPRAMRLDPTFKAELSRFLAVTGSSGIKLLLESGLEAGVIAREIPNQASAAIPGLYAEIFRNPDLIGSGDLGDIAFNAAKLDEGTRTEVFSLLGAFLNQLDEKDSWSMLEVARIVGRNDLGLIDQITRGLSSPETRETMHEAAAKARFMVLKPGKELTAEIENNIVGRPALRKAYRDTGGAHGHPKANQDEVLDWVRSLSGYKQKAALEGWVRAQQEENLPVAPLLHVLKNDHALKDALFMDRIIAVMVPSIDPDDSKSISALSSALEKLSAKDELLAKYPSLHQLVRPYE